MGIINKEVFGINENVAKEILNVALSTGGEFAEVYMENTSNESVEMLAGKVNKVNVNKVKGAAIRIIKDGTEVNCSLTKCDKDNLLSAAQVLSESFTGENTVEIQCHGGVLVMKKILDTALKCGARFLQTSTSEVYGSALQSPQNEDYWGNVNPIGIRSCYDEGKRAAETIMFDYHRQEQVKIRVVRIFNTYGLDKCH